MYLIQNLFQISPTSELVLMSVNCFFSFKFWLFWFLVWWVIFFSFFLYTGYLGYNALDPIWYFVEGSHLFRCSTQVLRASQVAQQQRIHLQCRSHMRCGFNPWVRRSPGGGNGKPPQYSCLRNSMDRGARQAIFHWVTKSRTWPKQLSAHTHMPGLSCGMWDLLPWGWTQGPCIGSVES